MMTGVGVGLLNIVFFSIYICCIRSSPYIRLGLAGNQWNWRDRGGGGSSGIETVTQPEQGFIY